MIGLTLKHLRYFQALARHGHFGHAADSCGISQPALSLQIKELEALIGAPLIERSSRQIRLTALGEAFASRADTILAQVQELGEFARNSQGALAGPLRIGVIPTIAPYLLPRVIQTLTRHHPGIEPEPREAKTGRLLRDLHEGRLDIAILALPVSEPGLHEEPLFDEEFVLVRPEGEAKAPVPDAEHLREMRLLLLEEGHCFRDQALSFCDPARRGAKALMEGSSLATLVQMVGAGIGVTLIPEMAVATETRSARVSVARLAAPRPKRSVGLVWRRSSPLSGDYQTLAKLLRDSLPKGAARFP